MQLAKPKVAIGQKTSTPLATPAPEQKQVVKQEQMKDREVRLVFATERSAREAVRDFNGGMLDDCIINVYLAAVAPPLH